MRVAINGFGRIGKMVVRALVARGLFDRGIDVAALADFPGDARQYAYQLRHDSVHRKFDAHIGSATSGAGKDTDDILIVNGSEISIVPAASDPAELPWKDLGVECVVDATGMLTLHEQAIRHLDAGAKNVIVTNIAESRDIKTIIMGVNDHEYDHKLHAVISNASCTSNCIVPVIHALQRAGIGISSGHLTVLLPFTASRKIIDSHSPQGFRDGRSAALNIIPSSAKTSSVIDELFPDLADRINEVVFRVPVAETSMIEFSFVTGKNSSIDEIDGALRQASASYLRGILGVSDDELVSTDVIDEDKSALYDSLLTLRSNFKNERRYFRIFVWFDNEWGYANRVVDMLVKISNHNRVNRMVAAGSSNNNQ